MLATIITHPRISQQESETVSDEHKPADSPRAPLESGGLVAARSTSSASSGTQQGTSSGPAGHQQWHQQR